MDHPKLRDKDICMTCSQPKNVGLVVCWSCYRRLDLRNGNPEAERALDAMEAAL